MKKMDQMPINETRDEVEEGLVEHEESKRLESKRNGKKTLFRDGEGTLYEIDDKSKEFNGYLVPGCTGAESPNTPFKMSVRKEEEDYNEAEESDDGDNLSVVGGFHFTPGNWRDELAGHSDVPPDVKIAIERSIEKYLAEKGLRK